MRTVNRNPEWENQPLRLNEEERQNLYGVLEDFFSSFDLQDIREILWNWLVAAMSSESGSYDTGHSRSNLFFVYERLESMIEAAHSITRRRKKKQRRHYHKWKQRV